MPVSVFPPLRKEFKCRYGLPPETPNLTTAELVHYGFQFGPCLGRGPTLVSEEMPSCPGWKVTVVDDELQMNYGMVEMVTKFMLEKPAGEDELRLIFSKWVAVEMVMDQVNIDSLEPGPSNYEILAKFSSGQTTAEFSVIHIPDDTTELCLYDAGCDADWQGDPQVCILD